MKLKISTFLILIIVPIAAISKENRTGCGTFEEFLNQFETDMNYQILHTNFPISIINLEVCDGVGNPRNDSKSGEPFPVSWCTGGPYNKEQFRNGLIIHRDKRIKMLLKQEINISDGKASVLNLCDEKDKNICYRYWSKYHFSQDRNGCWMLDKQEQRNRNK